MGGGNCRGALSRLHVHAADRGPPPSRAVCGARLRHHVASGVLFLVAYPDQYAYDSAFHLKLLCILLAGVNVACFYAGVLHRASGAISLVLWTTVIVCGRMITFYRPSPCRAGAAVGLLADCIVR